MPDHRAEGVEVIIFGLPARILKIILFLAQSPGGRYSLRARGGTRGTKGVSLEDTVRTHLAVLPLAAPHSATGRIGERMAGVQHGNKYVPSAAPLSATARPLKSQGTSPAWQPTA